MRSLPQPTLCAVNMSIKNNFDAELDSAFAMLAPPPPPPPPPPVASTPKRGKKRKLAPPPPPPSTETASTPTAAKKKKQRTRRVQRVSNETALADEINRMQSENADADAAIDAVRMRATIADAEQHAVALLARLDALLTVGAEAVAATKRYGQLRAQLEKQRGESAVVARVCDVFGKLLQATERARDSCAQLPVQFGQMYIRHEAFMRASSSALVPQGLALLRRSSPPSSLTSSATENGTLAVTAAAAAAAVSTTPPPSSNERAVALVHYGGAQSRQAFRLEEREPSQARVTELHNTYLGTSMLNANFDPRVTAEAKRLKRVDTQRRAAHLRAGGEVMPELFASHAALLQFEPRSQLLLAGAGGGGGGPVARVGASLLPPPPSASLTIEAKKK